jgi:hypothetical protein
MKNGLSPRRGGAYRNSMSRSPANRDVHRIGLARSSDDYLLPSLGEHPIALYAEGL